MYKYIIKEEIYKRNIVVKKENEIKKPLIIIPKQPRNDYGIIIMIPLEN